MINKQTLSEQQFAHNNRTMFNKIAKRYDLVNRMLSFGQDLRWRNELVKLLPNNSEGKILDLATGTGDVLFSLCDHDKCAQAIGIDPAQNMIDIAKKKSINKHLCHKLSFITGDACNINFASNSFDIVTMSFGIRNVANCQKALSEIYRILSPGGKVFIMEFSIPKNILLKQIYLFYFRYIMPLIGGLIAGNIQAYRYLNQSVESFSKDDEFLDLLENTGFVNTKIKQLTFGVANIYMGSK